MTPSADPDAMAAEHRDGERDQTRGGFDFAAFAVEDAAGGYLEVRKECDTRGAKGVPA